MLNTQTRQEGKASVVTIQGKISSEFTAQLRSVFRETITTQQPKLLVINLEGVDYIDSSGLGLLIALHQNMDLSSGKLRICGITPRVKRTMAQVNMTSYFSLFATEQDALRET